MRFSFGEASGPVLRRNLCRTSMYVARYAGFGACLKLCTHSLRWWATCIIARCAGLVFSVIQHWVGRSRTAPNHAGLLSIRSFDGELKMILKRHAGLPFPLWASCAGTFFFGGRNSRGRCGHSGPCGPVDDVGGLR
jgi:hypothetical protein